MSAYTDYEVIQACLAGDRDIFAELVKRYKNLVYSVILRMVNDREEANDLAQDVFIKMYKNLDKYYPEYKFSTWVIRIATNHVIDYRRKKKPETAPIEDLEFSLSSEESPEGAYIRRERKAELKKIVEDLPDMYKIPIVLYHEQGLSYQEISEIINEPLSKVKNRIFRGRRMLKESLLNLSEKGSVSYGL
ncbi:MAG: sigma-70 family RNA polymerase sigma factor [Clostridiales bacterium]|jgi:RNA polymerase sigma-70 factor (ECF subfamily)|nr:sigma-70 family RNA polymerase sigma factor [Clostridiales bacterium]